jgi:hypothetical protein
MLADPARRTLKSRPARSVCCAAKAHRSHVAVRGCALLATDSQQRPSVPGQSLRGQSVVADTLCLRNVRFADSNRCARCIRRLPDNPSHILCACYTIRRLPCAICGGMIPVYQSSTLRGSRFDCTARCAPSMSCSQAALHIALRLLRRRRSYGFTLAQLTAEGLWKRHKTVVNQTGDRHGDKH